MPAQSFPITSVLSMFSSFISGFREVDGGDLAQLAKLLFSVNTGLVALAGGGQTGATPLLPGLNQIKTVTSGSDSVQLPPAIPGLWVVVDNIGGNSTQVFGNPANPANLSAAGVPQGDTIAAHGSASQTATGTGVAQANAAIGIYFCMVVGQWKQLLTS